MSPTKHPLIAVSSWALVATLATPAWAGDSGADLKDWPRGPIRYIAEKSEIKLFKRLDSDRDRALFVERFWSRRDPSPETLHNEYRQIFWERVQQANDLFIDSGKPGWLTDRGKIYVLHGPPTEIEEDLDLDTGGLAAAGRGLVRWIYEGRPGGRLDLDPVTVVAFVRDAGGEYRISYAPRLSSVFFDALAIKEKRYEQMDRLAEQLGTPRKTDMSVMLDLGRMQEVPPQARILIERVETLESYISQPVTVQVARYAHPDRGGQVVVVTTDTRHVTPSVRPSVMARFSPRDATRETRVLGEDSFELAGTTREDRVAQGRLLLAAGTYDLTVVVLDPSTADTGIHRQVLQVSEVPAGDEAQPLRFSDTLLASEIESLPYRALVSYDEPFHVGPFRVVPRTTSDYRPGDTVKVFFEVYGGQPPYRIDYQVEGRELDGSWVALGQPQSSNREVRSQAWEVQTTARWPSGEYRISIEVTDRDEQLMSQRLPFSLIADDAP